MAGEWREVTIGDLVWLHDQQITPASAPAELFYHYSIPAYDSGQRPALESGSAIGSNKFVVPRGAVLVSKLNPRLPRVWAPDIPDKARAVASTEFLVLSPRDGFDRRFLKYLMLSPAVRSAMEGRVTGTSGSHQRVRPSDLLSISVEIPVDLQEQRAIAHILGTLDDKIELNRRMSETLEAMARALFKAWFVDFLPVRAKMAAKVNDPSLLLPQAEPGTWYVYAIECNDGSLYIGQTEDLRQRWLQHLGGKGASWTMQHSPVRVPYWEKQPSREAAVEREKWMKTGYGRKWLKKEIAARTQTGEPVRAKMEGRLPASAGQAGWQRGQSLPGLPAHLYDLFPDSFEDSELGEIPKGWEVKKLSDLCSTQYGYTASAVDEPVGPKFLRVTDINKHNWIEWGEVPHCAIEPDARASYSLQVGDLVVARMADPGKSAIIEEDIDAVFASYLVRLKTPSLGYSYYVYGFLKSDLYAKYAEGAKSGSVQSNMNAKVIVGASLAVPTKAIIDEFFRAVLLLRQRLVANVRQSRILAALRDALLPKLISGELRVKDAEQLIGRVV